MAEASSMMPDWCQLPEELLHLISKHLENCFDVVHARSACPSWRSSVPFPSCLLPQSYSLPDFADFPLESKDLWCTLEKIPLFLFRVRTPASLPSEYFVGGISRDESEDRIELLPSPLQCSVKVKIPKSAPTLINMLDCQVLPLGHQYRMIGCNHEGYRGVAFLPLNKDGRGGEFVVLVNFTRVLVVLTSTEMRWIRLNQISRASCVSVVTFRGRFYAAFYNGDIFILDPYSLQWNPLMHSQPLRSRKYLIPSGNDELFLFEKSPEVGVLDCTQFTFRLSRLDEEAGTWVEVDELGDRVLFIGHFGNVCCSAKELPDGCGVSGNSILFTNGSYEIFLHKYG